MFLVSDPMPCRPRMRRRIPVPSKKSTVSSCHGIMLYRHWMPEQLDLSSITGLRGESARHIWVGSNRLRGCCALETPTPSAAERSTYKLRDCGFWKSANGTVIGRLSLLNLPNSLSQVVHPCSLQALPVRPSAVLPLSLGHNPWCQAA